MYTNSITKPTSNTHQCIAVIGTVCIFDNLIPMTWSTHLLAYILATLKSY